MKHYPNMTCCWILCSCERIFIIWFILTILFTNCNTLINHQLAEVTFSGIYMNIWILSDRHFHLFPELPSNSDIKMSARGELHFVQEKMICRFEWLEVVFPVVCCCCSCVLLNMRSTVQHSCTQNVSAFQ